MYPHDLQDPPPKFSWEKNDGVSGEDFPSRSMRGMAWQGDRGDRNARFGRREGVAPGRMQRSKPWGLP